MVFNKGVIIFDEGVTIELNLNWNQLQTYSCNPVYWAARKYAYKF